MAPSEWGTSRPWYFPLTLSFWAPGAAGKRAMRSHENLLTRDEHDGPAGSKGPNLNVEAVGEELRAQVSKEVLPLRLSW